jgi:hypothetical protein
MVSDSSNGIYRGIIVAIAGLILIGANEPSNYSTSNAAAAHSDNGANQEKDVASGIRRIGEALEAQNTKTDPYEKERNEREIRDLQAQENSAYWAEAMFWATFAAIILSVIGIGLVGATFRETQRSSEAAEISKDAYIWNERGRISVQAEGTISIAIGEEQFIPIEIRNDGRSIVVFERVDFAHVWTPSFPLGKDFEGFDVERRVVGAGSEGIFSEIRPENFSNKRSGYLVGWLTYKTLNQSGFKTYFCFEVQNGDANITDGNVRVVRSRCENLPADT